ncbi:MAG: tyrosine-type recombinase/integrase [Candidatus Latescibacteria bacterium]|nr:tyrosine-type recombinase/integrase [Candidatus Latescibacterota bacterium]
MASISKYAPRDCWRVSYLITLQKNKIQRAKYAKTKPEARVLATRLEQLEAATRSGVVADRNIEDWIDRGWLKEEEAARAFPGYAETVERKRRLQPRPTDYQKILDAYERYAIENSKSKSPDRKTHKNHMSYARQVVSWLESAVPNLKDLTPELVREYQNQLQGQFASWTVFGRLTKLRLLVDQAVGLGMIADNPARQLSLRQPKTLEPRRILTEAEIHSLLEVSLRHRHWINGGLPTVVRLGLYAGLRNEEMCWLKWHGVDFDQRIITIKESVCEVTGQVWAPKDYEMRRIDVKPACIDYLAEEQQRQQEGELLGPFVLPGGGSRRPGFREKPLSQDAPQKAFAKMTQAEGMAADITIYSLRHSYATMALRSGVDLRTLQKRMGHSDLKTTMEYLHFIEPEAHPMDKLPY